MYGLPADSVRGQKAHRVKFLSSKYFSVIYSDPIGYRFKKVKLIKNNFFINALNLDNNA